MMQQVLPLAPADAFPISEVAAVQVTDAGGVVFINGAATFPFPTGDEVARRLAAVLVIEQEFARVGPVAAAFGITQETLWNWRNAYRTSGTAGLIPAKKGPKRASKLTGDKADRIRELHSNGLTLAQVVKLRVS